MLDPSLMIDAVPRIPAGLGLTLQLLLVSAVLGLLIAILLLLMRISGRRWLSWPSQVYIYVFRGTPILVQIFIIYHGLPQFDWIRDSFSGRSCGSPMAVPCLPCR
jgi:polar amino acid transport system permease protein